MTPEQLKASILQRAMEGKLVPQDPNDEPASELLKKIKTEKEKLIKEGKIKRDKNETEIFRGDDGLHYEKFQDGSVKQIDVPFEIPESWEWVSLNSVSKKITDGSHNPPPNAGIGIQIISAKNIIDGKIDFSLSQRFLTKEEFLKEDSRTEIRAGDILLSIVGSIGKVALAPENIDFTAQRSVSVIKTLLIDNTYLSLVFSSPYFQTTLIKKSSGTAQKGIYLGELKQILIPLPPLNEQFKIVDKFNLLLKKYSLYNSLYLSLMNLNLDFPEKLRKSILQYAMQGKLVPQDATDEPVEVLLEKIREEKQKLFTEGKLKKKDLQESIIYQDDDNSYYENCPNTWAKVSLATISKITSGGTPKTDLKEYYNGEIPWFTPADLNKAQSNYYLDNSLKSITRLGLKNSSAQLIDAYSIVYSSRAPIGYINIVPRQYTTNQGCKSLTPYLVIVKWLYFAMKYATADIKKNASGTTFLEISASKLGDIYIDLPPISEQERIVDTIEKLWNKIDTLPFTP